MKHKHDRKGNHKEFWLDVIAGTVSAVMGGLILQGIGQIFKVIIKLIK